LAGVHTLFVDEGKTWRRAFCRHERILGGSRKRAYRPLI